MDAKIGIENLILARDALTALNIRYFLTDGTLLGLVRHGGFIDWDHDIDIGVFAEDFNFLSFGRYASHMRRKGFVYKLYGDWGKYFGSHWRRKNGQVDIGFYFRQGDQRVVHLFDFDRRDIIELSYPAWMIETLSPVDFYGKTFIAPKNKREMLSHLYGDWKIPRPDWDYRTSPLNITRRTRWTKLKVLQSKVLNRIFALLARGMGRLIPPR
jgi:hypothetical protein